MINSLFESIRDDKQLYLNAREGSEFEDRVVYYLKSTLGLTRILRRDVVAKDWAAISSQLANKFGTEYLNLPNKKLRKTFIYQPRGKQEFPDIIVFSDKKVIPIEIKFSANSQTKPMWNSNVPRANAFYIFGSYGLQDITFFCGDSIISPKHRERLYGFFDDIKKLEDEIRTKMPELDTTDRGFTPYIRAAFDQKKHKDTVVTNFFTHPKRIEAENLAIEKLKAL
ncbi:MAG: hypothetical protein G01um10143_601 [Parcubacteria group bacterium Gr01-1014_3]|nr:MAG: hypothetical protein G01um10143_601 [Parcubacteria group bacterium Gr01-1014_3]